MPEPKSRQGQPKRTVVARRARPALPLLLGALVLLGILLTGTGFGFAATQETHDAFCASCHSQPESSFFERSVAAAPVDLASFHTTRTTRCIDCHSGVGTLGRVQAELLGARNAVLWNTGRAVQPAPLTVAIADPNCLKCHQEVTAGRGRNNHFHAFLARWQTADPNAGHCVSCHAGHSTGGSVETGYQDQAQTQAVCEACHTALGEGGED